MGSLSELERTPNSLEIFTVHTNGTIWKFVCLCVHSWFSNCMVQISWLLYFQADEMGPIKTGILDHIPDAVGIGRVGDDQFVAFGGELRVSFAGVTENFNRIVHLRTFVEQYWLAPWTSGSAGRAKDDSSAEPLRVDEHVFLQRWPPGDRCFRRCLGTDGRDRIETLRPFAV